MFVEPTLMASLSTMIYICLCVHHQTSNIHCNSCSYLLSHIVIFCARWVSFYFPVNLVAN